MPTSCCSISFSAHHPSLQHKESRPIFHSSQHSRSCPCSFLPARMHQAWVPPPLPAEPSSQLRPQPYFSSLARLRCWLRRMAQAMPLSGHRTRLAAAPRYALEIGHGAAPAGSHCSAPRRHVRPSSRPPRCPAPQRNRHGRPQLLDASRAPPRAALPCSCAVWPSSSSGNRPEAVRLNSSASPVAGEG